MRHGRLFLWPLLVTFGCGRSVLSLSGEAGSAGRGGAAGVGGKPSSSGAGGTSGTHGASSGSAGRGPITGETGGGTSVGGTAGARGGTAGRAGLGGSAGKNGGRGGHEETMAGAGFGGSPDGPRIVYVSQLTGSDESDGSTWATAVASVTRGLTLTDSDSELWITRGTYYPGSGNQATFSVTHGETLRGGFDGTEATPAERRDGGRPTLLTGELGNDDTLDDNSFHVVTTTGSTFDRIDVTGGNAIDSSQGGGGIVSTGDLRLIGCSIHENRSTTSGGGVLAEGAVTIQLSNFFSNVANDNGGAVAALGTAPLLIVSSVFTGNSANFGGAVLTSSKSASVVRSTFDQNFVNEDGGGVYTEPGGTLTVTESSFDSNTAIDGSAIQSLGVLTLGASSFHDNSCAGGKGVVSLGASAEVTDSEFYGNQGSPLYATGGSSACNVDVSASTFVSNTTAIGAGIHTDNCELSVTSSDFSYNIADITGGAIAVRFGGLTLDDVSLYGNAAGSNGGAIYVDSAALSMTDSLVAEGTAEYGAGIYLVSTRDSVIERVRLTTNAATYEGGGLFAWGTYALAVGDTALSRNTAVAGGALYGRAPLAGTTLTNVTLTGNVASSGAAIDFEGPLAIRNSILWADQPAELLLDSADNLTLDASNLSGSYPGLVALDPRFIEPVSGLGLSSDSPCIDTADDAYASTGDMWSSPRFDVPDVPVCPSGTPSCGSVADMGAYERQN